MILHIRYSHSMRTTAAALKPRKMPVQARSIVTVDAICEATIQVLVGGGIKRLNTTRVAERAGVSVGSLYQYFPNRQSLLAAVLERHLLQVVEAVERTCERHRGSTLAEMARALVVAYTAAKLARPDVSVALYAVAGELDGTALVARMRARSRKAVSAMLASASDARIPDPDAVSLVLLSSISGPVQAVLENGAARSIAQKVKAHLVVMTKAYLRDAAAARLP
jgi:AcrR family transcriptional regulator